MLGESAGAVYEPALELIAAIQISVKEMQLIAWLISKANRTNSICRHAIAREERAWREWLSKRVAVKKECATNLLATQQGSLARRREVWLLA